MKINYQPFNLLFFLEVKLRINLPTRIFLSKRVHKIVQMKNYKKLIYLIAQATVPHKAKIWRIIIKLKEIHRKLKISANNKLFKIQQLFNTILINKNLYQKLRVGNKLHKLRVLFNQKILQTLKKPLKIMNQS